MSDVSRVFHPLRARNRDEPHRTATPLELFTDLCFVVAVAQVAAELHHAVVEDHVVDGLWHFALMFWAVYWAWLNFVWFASAYDNDDVGYRLLTMLQVVGVLMVAAGIPRAFDDDFSLAVAGYIVMRVALVTQWIRVSYADPDCRQTALRYALGIMACQVGWTVMLFLPDEVQGPVIIGLLACEMVTPAWAEAANPTPWHPRHIAERYGLFTIIVLGESVLSATIAIQVALDEGAHLSDLLAIVIGGVLIVFSLWWLYFAKEAHRVLVDNRVGFRFGYGHYFLFASGAAVGAGLAIQVDQATHHSLIGDTTAAAFVTVPVVLFFAATWVSHLALHEASRGHGRVMAAVAAVVLLATFTPEPVLVTGVACAALIGVLLGLASRASADRS
jgi:low temperature requirement protein LtrA